MRSWASTDKWLNHWGALVALMTVGCGGAAKGPQALMTPSRPLDLTKVPWPSDALRGGDGKLQVPYPLPFYAHEEQNNVQLAASLSQLDGFSTTRSVYFPVDEDVVVDDGAAATVVDLDEPSKRWSYPLYYRSDYKQLVAMAPLGTALDEQHVYGCWVTSGVHDADGHSLRAAADMRDAMAGKGVFGTLSAYQKLAATLRSQMVKPIAATAFTTQSLRAWVPKVLTDLMAMPPMATLTRIFSSADDLDALFGGMVTTTRPGRPSSGGVLHDQVAFVLEGTYDVPHYLSATPGSLGLFDDAETVKSIDHVPFLLVLPTHPPNADYSQTPVVIFQHGIDDDRSEALTVANDYAARGYATLGIDELWHGSRLPGAVDNVFNLSGAPGSDGIGDPGGDPVYYFFDFGGDPSQGILTIDGRCIRDNFRQAAVDLMQEVRLARGGDLSALAGADARLAALSLDGSSLVYTSESFGSILGAIVLAIDPQLPAAVLDVGAGGLVPDLLPNSAQFEPLLQPLMITSFDKYADVSDPMMLPAAAQLSLGMVQQLLEPADGLALASGLDPQKSVLFLVDHADETVPNEAEEALALAYGAVEVDLAQQSQPLAFVKLPTKSAPYSAAPLRAIVEMQEAGHGMFTKQADAHNFQWPFPPFTRLPAAVPIDNPIETLHALALDFIDGMRAGVPMVSDPTMQPTPLRLPGTGTTPRR